jgi:valyl-tRNA synthetase
VATTRPETMLGDAAVAVNPKDKRYKKLIGKVVILPIINREIPIIADKTIEMEFGTGAVKVTPAHDIADFEIGERHKLPAYKIINQFGKMSSEASAEYEGLKAKDAREKIVAELEKQNLIEKIDDYDLRISKCYRCGNIIEPQISKQWFLKMSRLAEIAKKAVKNKKIKFYPKRWEKVYLDWLNNIKDWCVSRQIWWGHKIPLKETDDVLDTWFSSALWPFATLGWPASAKNLKEFYPTQVLSTARDIINLWVARMIFSGSEFMGKEPFSEIIIHPTILTKDGKRMSKSLGTGIDPMILIASHGADATRFGLIFQTMGGQDIHFSEDHIVAGKKFCNKIWNATRFVLERSAKEDINGKKLSKEDKKILRELDKVKKTVNKNIDEYKFGHAIRALHEFFWHEFCDKYIEYAKEQKNKNTDAILSHILIESLKLLHPFMPFITEEIWSFIPGKHKTGKMLIIEKWTRK